LRGSLGKSAQLGAEAVPHWVAPAVQLQTPPEQKAFAPQEKLHAPQ
jgi:hypothetical protein